MVSEQDGGAPRDNAYHNLKKRTGGRGGMTVVKELSQGTEDHRHKGGGMQNSIQG